jgi:peptidoglycan hydrolase-like protein with peptidoglycan-binding domain
VRTERIAGMLSYGPATVVRARASAAPPTAPAPPADPAAPAASPSPTAPATTNTVTWLPPPGTVIQPGAAVYKVDNRPVVLLSGETPLYHVLAVGVAGPDVRMLETNLSALGYGGFTVDDAFTAATESAVKRWQKDLGLVQTGTVDVNQVVVAPGAVRVTEHKTAAGADATGEVLAYTGTTRGVIVPLEVTRQHLVTVGLVATVNLPGGRTVTGTVASIGTVAHQAGGQSGGGDQPATVDVEVGIADQAALGSLDAAPVDLMLVVAERKDVLTVPVAALVALAEGGYGVQVVEGATTRYIAVKPGMFAAGQVEVTGDGIAEGVVVGVPA